MALGKQKEHARAKVVDITPEVVEVTPEVTPEVVKETPKVQREATWTELMNAKRGLKPNGEKFK